MSTCSVLIRRAVCFWAAVLLATAITVATGAAGTPSPTDDGAVPVEQLPYCDEDVARQRDLSDGLVFVTTLDGKLSALDMLNGGTERWSIQTGPGPLLSSSIHRLELTNNGRWVRMIPSLGGSLYKFDGDSIEPIPFSAEDMLKSSFKFSDDLVISGGKETRSYGVSLQTGQLLYLCTMHGCKNATELATEPTGEAKYGPPGRDDGTIDGTVEDDVIIIRRQTQTVRAVEARTGSERWNFSIGHHELERARSEECRGGRERSEANPIALDLEIKVIIPEGVICAIRKSAPGEIVWRHKFEVPIVSAWRSSDKSDGLLEGVDLFDRTDWLWNGNVGESGDDGSEGDNKVPPLVNPSLYIGMHDKQLYIQESSALLAEREGKSQELALLTDGDGQLPAIPWKPLPASSAVAGLLTGEEKDVALGTPSAPRDDNGESTAIARSVLYASSYINGNGFFLVFDDPNSGDQRCEHDGDDHTKDNSSSFPPRGEDDDLDAMFEVPVKVIIISMWFWWKEILIISVTTALLFNMVLKLRIEKPPAMVVVERKIEVPISMAVEAREEFPLPAIRMPSARSLSESSSQGAVALPENYTSRFREDFDLVQCLGKGGFGVVFEVRNRLDDCRYAIKRVVLPNKPESKDRVMREVKTLAHSEHQNIVRYFHAWIETPPPGWQERHDREWIERNCLSTSIDIETPTDTQPPAGALATSASLPTPFVGVNKAPLSSAVHPHIWMPHFPEANGSITSGERHLEQSESCSFIEFRADAVQSSAGSQQPSGPVNDESSESSQSEHEPSESAKSSGVSCAKRWDRTDENDDSFDIVFKEPSCNGTANGVHNSVSIDVSASLPPPPPPNGDGVPFGTRNPFRKTHRRPLSLDLTSTGNVRKRPTTDEESHPESNTASKAPSYASSTLVPQSNKIYLYIQMQLCHKQSLKEWLSLNGFPARRDKIVPIFEQIVAGVEYVHLKGLIHRDLKPSNIFFSLDGKIKIGDFGLVTDSGELQYDSENNMPAMGRDRHTRQVGTQLYMSPEQLRGLPYDYKVDIYSLGLILFELLVSFGTEMERIGTLKSVRKTIFPHGFEQEYQCEYKLLSLMLADSPKKRPTTFGIKAHPPFKRMLSNKSSNALGAVDETLVVDGSPTVATNGGSFESEEGDEWHFELPPRRKDSRTYSSSGSGSGGAGGTPAPQAQPNPLWL